MELNFSFFNFIKKVLWKLIEKKRQSDNDNFRKIQLTLVSVFVEDWKPVRQKKKCLWIRFGAAEVFHKDWQLNLSVMIWSYTYKSGVLKVGVGRQL